MKARLWYIFFTGCLCFFALPGQSQEGGWQILFDGTSLEQWETYLGPRWNPDSAGFAGDPVGLNHDPEEVFSIIEEGEDRILRISGQVWGGISTLETFSNYHLTLQFRWGSTRWTPRDSSKRDSGLLYHGVGPHGAGSGFWLRSQEFQIQEGDCGDYWAVAGAMIDIPAVFVNDSIYRYTPGEILQSFGEPPANTIPGIYCKKHPDAEYTTGEWNRLDLYVLGDRSVHVVNGIEVMRLYNSRQYINGEIMPLMEGRIQLQSESAEVFYKDIRIRPIDRLPAGH